MIQMVYEGMTFQKKKKITQCNMLIHIAHNILFYFILDL